MQVDAGEDAEAVDVLFRNEAVVASVVTELVEVEPVAIGDDVVEIEMTVLVPSDDVVTIFVSDGGYGNSLASQLGTWYGITPEGV